ncbi:MAG: DnaJ domain-containing protein [Deltaproteobacteria bacterium]|nr:DnaJ domain-containing protein [Deltaproteobacteria bacterium]
MAKRDYYEVLGVKRDADDKAIKAAYRRLAKQYHPDFNPGDKASETRFKEVNEAYAVLSNAEARAKYDRFGHAGNGQPGFDFSNFDYRNMGGSFSGFGQTFEAEGFADILQELFGGRFDMGGRPSRGFGGHGGRSGGGRRTARGQDVEAEIRIPFMDAIRGTQMSVTVQQPGGPDHITFKIPAGIADGGKIRLRGKGGAGGGGASGDLILRVTVEPHHDFVRDGDDLRVSVPVTVAEAVCGAKIPVPTPDGTSTIAIAPGTSSGQVLRLAGKGVARKGHTPGDLFVTIRIVVPKNVDEKSRELIREFDRMNPVHPRGAN